MKKSVVVTALLLAASSVTANEYNPVVDEYKQIAALQKVAPDTTYAIVTINANTASSCDSVLSYEKLIQQPSVPVLLGYVTRNGQDGSSQYRELLKKSVVEACTTALNQKLDVSRNEFKGVWDDLK